MPASKSQSPGRPTTAWTFPRSIQSAGHADGSRHNPTATWCRPSSAGTLSRTFSPKIRSCTHLPTLCMVRPIPPAARMRVPTAGMGFHTGTGCRILPLSGEVLHRVRLRSRCGRRS